MLYRKAKLIAVHIKSSGERPLCISRADCIQAYICAMQRSEMDRCAHTKQRRTAVAEFIKLNHTNPFPIREEYHGKIYVAPLPKPRAEKTALNAQLNRLIPKPRMKVPPLDTLPNRPIPKPRMKKLEREAENKPAYSPNKRNLFLRDWKLEQVPENNDLTFFLRDKQSWAFRILRRKLY